MQKVKFIEPNFSNSNLNISSTLAEFLGVENKNAVIPELKEELDRSYKNVVFICFDGLGINSIEINLPENAILRKNIRKTLVSTFPSTTTNATSLFKVKNGLETEFERKFNGKYSEDFVLFKSKDLIERGYFGDFGDKGFLLGDYIAIGTYTNKVFLFCENNRRYKGLHTSLTKEKEVPLILIAKKN